MGGTYFYTTTAGRELKLLYGDRYICEEVRKNDVLSYDIELLHPLLPYLDAETLVIDIGAYIGDHTDLFARFGGQVIAIEPNPLAFEALRHNVGWRNNVLCLNVGIGDRHCWGTLAHGEEGNIGNTTIDTGNTEGRVQVYTLDALPVDVVDGSSALIKIDVEGMEPEVLRGGAELIERLRPVMLIEVNRAALAARGSTPGALLDMIRSLGYEVLNVRGGDLDGDLWDALCIPKERE